MTVGVRLRVVADDVGQSAAIDDGVAALARSGHLSAASVLVRAPGAPAAMATLGGILPLGVHVHLEPDEIADADAARVVALITEQVEAMLAAGHSPAHLDLHTAALYGLGPHPVRPGGVLAEAIEVAAAHRLRFRLPRLARAGVSSTEIAAHAQAVAAADAAGVVLPDVLVTEVPDAADVPAFLAKLPDLLAVGGPGSPDARSPGTDVVASHADMEVELITHPALRAEPGDPLGPERVRQHALLASGALHPR